jgi:two-component system phosphate regulon sensor histidine kinase PhoR
MFAGKNISLTRLSFLVAVCVSLLQTIIFYFYSSNTLFNVLLFLFAGILTYFFIYYFIERFVFRKIKLIYKFISQTKATKREEFYTNEILPVKTIEEVQEDVLQWADERKKEMDRLQNNEQFRKEFLMNVAHELKTPIFAAQGYIETLLDGALEDEKVSHLFLQKASKSIDRLSELVKDLDEISRIESNQLVLHKTSFVIQDLLREVFEELRFKSDQKHIKLSIKKGCEQDVLAFADKAKIKQVLVNLVENSINYGKHDGETTAGIYIVDAKQCFIEITDNGMGIAEEHIPRLFERFYRTDAARSRNAGGSGLGLAIVKHIIEAHNGTVQCRSKQDVGTSFAFTLDRNK